MPTYKILGIHSFADTIRNVALNDNVILKKEKYNIKSKNAIGVYDINDKKLGYLPHENKDEVDFFNNSYKISKIILNCEFPLVEISRFYELKNNIFDLEFPYIKNIKYDHKIIECPKLISDNLNKLVKYLQTKKIKISKCCLLYYDDNYINIGLETKKHIQIYYTVTYNYFKNNIDRYEEMLEYNLIDHTFYRDLLIYRLESYYEANYKNINLMHVDYIKSSTIKQIDKLELPEEIDIILFVKLYINSILTNDSLLILKYLNKFNINSVPIMSLLDDFIITNNIKLGCLTYDHKLNIYSWVEFINDDTIFIIDNKFEYYNILNCFLLNYTKLIYYNPNEGIIEHYDLNNYDFSKDIKN